MQQVITLRFKGAWACNGYWLQDNRWATILCMCCRASGCSMPI